MGPVVPSGHYFRPCSALAISRLLVHLMDNVCVDAPHDVTTSDTYLALAIASDVCSPGTKKMQSTMLLLKHGAILPYDVMCDVACNEWKAGWWKDCRCQFFDKSFARFLRLVGIRITYIPLIRNKIVNAARALEVEAFFETLLDVTGQPLTLQQVCVIIVRSTLRTRGPLWTKIDTLPLPKAIQNILKLNSKEYQLTSRA